MTGHKPRKDFLTPKLHFKTFAHPRPGDLADLPPLPPDTMVVYSKMMPGGCFPLVDWTGTEWRKIENLLAPVPACDRYAEGQVWVDLRGEVFEMVGGKLRRIVACVPEPSRACQYPTVSIYDHKRGRRESAKVHALIARAWAGHVPKPGLVVRHMDDVPSNNNPANIAIGTFSQNARDAIRNGKTRATPPEIVRAIWDEYRGRHGEVKTLAERHGVTTWIVAEILNGRVRHDVTGDGRHPLAGKQRPSRQAPSLTPAQARATARLPAEGLGLRKIAALTGVGWRSVEAALQD